MSRKFSDVDIALPISVELRARRFPAEKNPTVFFPLPASGDGRDEEPACFVLGVGGRRTNTQPSPSHPHPALLSTNLCAASTLSCNGLWVVERTGRGQGE